MGLPYVSLPQAEMIDGLREKIAESARSMDLESLKEGWFSGTTPGMEIF